MHSTMTARWMAAGLMAVLLPACSGATQALTPTTSSLGPAPSFAAFNAAGTSGIYVSDFSSNTIDLFSDTGTLKGRLTDCTSPSGLAVDHAGNLWAACEHSHTVNEYAPGATSATAVLSDPNEYPVDVAVDRHGYVFVSNVAGLYSVPAGIVYYAPGATTPTGSINDPAIESGRSIDTDSGGFLYAAYISKGSYATKIVYYKSPETGGKGPQPTNIPIVYTGGVKIGGRPTLKHGPLWIANQNAPAVEEFANPGFALLTSQNPGFGDPTGFGFGPAGKWYAIADSSHNVVYRVNTATGAFIGKPIGAGVLTLAYAAAPFPSNK